MSVVECSWAPRPACEAVAAFLASGGAPTALLCVNDRVAFGAPQALHEAERRVPSEVSIVSFDESDLARWTRPGLTSAALPHEAMGRAAVELLLEPPEEPSVRRLETPVRRRDSVGLP